VDRLAARAGDALEQMHRPGQQGHIPNPGRGGCSFLSGAFNTVIFDDRVS